ncbi:IS21-like element helper ATPase IstB [Aliiglaciecola sp.]|nr:IS21-like element helper ATPase IstB [Aliiglaciecola sp.]
MLINESIENRLKELKLGGIQAALMQQNASGAFCEMSFLERLEHLLRAQVVMNKNRRITTLQKQANLRWPQANLGDLDYSLQPSLKKQVIAELLELNWVRNANHLILTGATGTGKTHLACAFANAAILCGFPVKFYKFQHLLAELIAADQENELAKLRKRLARFKVLVIDDWGISMLGSAQRHMLFDLVESRDKQASMIITSQYPKEDWYDAFGDATIAESVLDRIVHSSHTLNLAGISMRKVNGLGGECNE